MTENYIYYLEEENMLQIFGDTFTLEIKVLRWFSEQPEEHQQAAHYCISA